jgi:hypothetical protein
MTACRYYSGVAYTHQIHFTKNMLDGPLAGCQLRASVRVRSAFEAGKLSSDLATGGIHTDPLTEGAWTAHNVHIASLESELADLIEPVNFRRLDEDELANLADALEAREAA